MFLNMIAQQKTRNMLSLYMEKKEFVFLLYLARHVIQNAYVSSGFRSVIRDILLFIVSTFTDLQAENERKQFPQLFSPSHENS